MKKHRNSSTQRPLGKNHCCPFSFNIIHDDYSFHLVNGCGIDVHQYHPKLELMMLKKIAQSILEAQASVGVIRNIINHCAVNSILLI